MGLDMRLCTNSRELARDIYDSFGDGRYNPLYDFDVEDGCVIRWRGAVSIHRWLLEHARPRMEFFVEDLARLHDDCKRVLDSSELVPTMNGYELLYSGAAMELIPSGMRDGEPEPYDADYVYQLRYTMKQLGKILDILEPMQGRPFEAVHPDEPRWRVGFWYDYSR